MSRKALALAAGCALIVGGCQRQASTAAAPPNPASAASVPAPRPLFTFKGVPFGASVAEFKAKLPEVHCGEKRCGFPEAPNALTYAEVPMYLGHAEFGPTGLDAVDFMFKPGEYDKLLDALKSKYGPPTKETNEEVKTIGGQPLQQATAVWLVQGPGVLQIRRFWFNSEHGYFSAVTSANLDRSEAEAASAAKRIKKDM